MAGMNDVPAHSSTPSSFTVSGLVRSGARRVIDPRGIAARVAALEAEAVEARELNVRIAELTDLVAELLVPLAETDPDRARELVARYRDSIG